MRPSHSPTPRQADGRGAAAAPALSVVVPFFDEAANVGPLLEELRATLDALAVSAEVVLVDDGSRDGTWDELRAAAASDPRIRLERFDHNRGQAAALWHGFHVACGAWIATLDGDGQNPPAEIGRLWALRHEADLLTGVRAVRHDGALRRAMSRLANTARRRLLGDGVSDGGCGLKLFRRGVEQAFLPIRTMYSFLPAFAVAAGWRVIEVPVAHRPRRHGTSKYGLRAMAALPALDALALWWILRHRRAPVCDAAARSGDRARPQSSGASRTS